MHDSHSFGWNGQPPSASAAARSGRAGWKLGRQRSHPAIPPGTTAPRAYSAASRLVGKAHERPILAGQAGGTYSLRGGAVPVRGLRSHSELELQAQIDEVVGYTNNSVTGDIVQILLRLDGLKVATDRVARLATERSTEAYQKARAEVDELRRKLDRSAALDLRWAIFGVYVTTIGVALSFWVP
jgi:hypothetical protein